MTNKNPNELEDLKREGKEALREFQAEVEKQTAIIMKELISPTPEK